MQKISEEQYASTMDALLAKWGEQQAKEAARMTPTVMRQGYLIETVPPAQGEYRHRRFGALTRKGAACPVCGKPMLCLLEIDTRDPRLGLARLPYTRLPLVYCLSCTLCLGEFAYRIDGDKALTVVQLGEPQSEEVFAGEIPNPPSTPVRLTPITEDEQAFLAEGHRSFPTSWDAENPPPFAHLYGHNNQLGGQPLLEIPWQDEDFTCPSCQKEMRFLATVNDLLPDGAPLCGEDNYLQIVFAFCRDCHIVAVSHANPV